MLITLAGLVIVVVAAVFVAWPLLAPSATAEVVEHASVEPSELEKEKDSALVAIRDVDFDHSVGKLSDDDHAAMRAELEQRAMRALAALDASAASGAGSADASTEPGLRALRGHGSGSETAGGGFCPSCGHRFGREASFCAGCGKKLPSGGRRAGRRRATS